MPKLPSKPDFIIDRVLAQAVEKTLLTDAQIDKLVAISDPPAGWLRDSIALEFERAALVLFSGRAVVGHRAERQTFRNQLYDAQKYAEKLRIILANMNPELKLHLNRQFEATQKSTSIPIALVEIEHLLDHFVDIDLPYQTGGKSDDVLVWVIDGLVHAFNTRLTPAFKSCGQRKKGKWFSKARQAKLICCFLKSVEPGQSKRYTFEYISYLVNRSNREGAAPVDLKQLTNILRSHQTS